MTLNCIIIEDQLQAQLVIKNHIEKIPHLKLLGTYTNALEATPMLKSNNIDLVFLDINLPRINGIDFLKSVDNPPSIIITTAYSEYAVEGFNLAVTDYLVKPISFERFLTAISRVNKNSDVTDESDMSLSKEFIFAKDGHSIIKIYLKDIKIIKSDTDFTIVILENRQLLLAYSLKFWEGVLPKTKFFRCHKSYIINIEKISKIMGNTIYIQKNMIPIGRSNKDALLKKINLI